MSQHFLDSCLNERRWHVWFAWYPVLVDNFLDQYKAYCTEVARRLVDLPDGTTKYEYRLYDNDSLVPFANYKKLYF